MEEQEDEPELLQIVPLFDLCVLHCVARNEVDPAVIKV